MYLCFDVVDRCNKFEDNRLSVSASALLQTNKHDGGLGRSQEPAPELNRHLHRRLGRNTDLVAFRKPEVARVPSNNHGVVQQRFGGVRVFQFNLSHTLGVQRSRELNRAARDVLRKSEVEVDAEEEEGDGVGVSDVDRLDVVVDSDHSHRIHNLESVVKTLFGCGRVTVHVI